MFGKSIYDCLQILLITRKRRPLFAVTELLKQLLRFGMNECFHNAELTDKKDNR